MGFFAWLIIGGLAGWIAGNIMRGGGFGIIANIGVGIVGAVIGGFLFSLLGLS
ncbi:GlsB/YeaQ/YmgE family stress response membrane protein, partial [Halomonas sp. 707D7]